MGLLAMGYLARVLGPSDFGTMSLGLAVFAYALIVGNSGLALLGTRKVAGGTDDTGSLVGGILTTRFFLSLVAYVVGTGVILFIVASREVFAVLSVFLLGVFPSALLLDWFFQGRQAIRAIAGGQLWGMLSYLVFVFLFVKHPEDIVWVGWGWTFGIWANAIFMWVVFKREKHPFRLQWSRSRIWSLLKEAFPLGVASVITQVVMQFPPIYLSLVAARSDVGLFSAAFKMTVFLLIFNRVFSSIFFPGISRCHRQFPERLEENVRRVLKCTAVFAFSVGLLAVLSGDFLIRWIFGASFGDAVFVFRVLVGYFVLKLLNSVLTFTLVGMEREKVYTKALVGGMIAFFGFLLALTRPLGLVGVACALIAGQLTVFVTMAVALKGRIRFSYTRTLVVPFLGTALVFLPLLSRVAWVLPVKLIVAVVVVVPLIAWLGGIRWEDMAFLREKFL